jgi:hypothetical protein
MPPVAAWMQFIKDIGWSKDDMNEEVQAKTDDKLLAYYAQRKAEKEKQQQGVAEGQEEKCPHCGGAMFSEMIMNEKKDACYYKVKSRYKVWPSAYASGALVKCRKSGADSWGNGGKKNESIEEGLDEAVGDNYLYHATQPGGIMRILRTGVIKASDRPQAATKSKTQYPTVSTTRSKQYAESEDFVDFLNLTRAGNSVIIVFDRNAVANHYKMFSTSQGTQTVGDEFEEVIVVPKGAMPIQGTMKGFYFNPKRTAEIEEFKDTPWFKELLNSPYYMGQKQSVAEGSQSKDDLIWTLNNFDYYTDNGNVYVNDNGDKIARIGSNWKHQSGKMGSGAEELSAFFEFITRCERRLWNQLSRHIRTRKQHVQRSRSETHR